MRIKFMVANIDTFMLNKIINHAIQNDYCEGAIDGYRIDSYSELTVSGRYFFKREQLITTVDPFGNELTYNALTYDVTKFMISVEYPQITIYEPPRNITLFLNSISSGTEYTFTSSAIAVDVIAWIRNIEKHIDSVVIVKSITASGVTLSNYVNAKLQLVGTEDVRDYLPIITSGKQYYVDKAKIASHQFDCEITKSGGLMISGQDVYNATKVIAKSLPC